VSGPRDLVLTLMLPFGFLEKRPPWDSNAVMVICGRLPSHSLQKHLTFILDSSRTPSQQSGGPQLEHTGKNHAPSPHTVQAVKHADLYGRGSPLVVLSVSGEQIKTATSVVPGVT
jgi:hypothetical protein